MSEHIHKYQPWFTLKEVSGIGNVLYKRLLDKFGTPEDVLHAPSESFAQIKGINSKIINRIKTARPSKKSSQEIKNVEKSGFSIITINDAQYPVLLKEIPDPPPFLVCFGSMDNISPCIAVVGSRLATDYGLQTASRLSKELASKGFQVVSGMARGIDSAAHLGALEAGGRTVAVLGSGLNRIYPIENRKLYHRIAEQGAVISEFNLNAGPDARHFPIRNRIIAGMSTGTIVVEAAAKSGSLITARLAGEYDREVFAVPGNVDSFKSTGTHALLRQGAKLVENHQDVIEELHHVIHEDKAPKAPCPKDDGMLFTAPSGKKPCKKNPFSPALPEPANKYQRALMDILTPDPLHIDIIIDRSGLDTGGISAALFDLEMQGIVKQFPGKLFSF